MTHLEGQGLLGNTIVIFTSDHGDYDLQRKGIGLPQCLVRIPLIFMRPGIVADEAMRTDCAPLVDVMPTLCEALAVEMPYGVQGRSLWPLLMGQEYPRDEFRSAYAEVGVGGLHYGEGDTPHPFPAGGTLLRFAELHDAERQPANGADGSVEADLRHDGPR